MTDQFLYTHACEMLERTNVFQKPADSFLYHLGPDHEVSLLSLIKSHPGIGNRRMSSDQRLGGRKNNEVCYKAISDALISYVKSYPAPSSYKSRLRDKFVLWLEAIRKEYHLSKERCSVPEELYPAEGEKDTVVMLLKSLQARGGITKKELKDNLGISSRAILKDMCKLDPSLGKTDPYTSQSDTQPFYLGGQRVTAKIRAVKKPGSREHSYMTVNTVHPLILQENLMQAGTLLLALARNWRDYDSNLSQYIGTDIWFQLTEYAQERIRKVFIPADPIMAEFLNYIESAIPDDKFLQLYRTEREMMHSPDYSMTAADQLIYFSKAGSRTCRKLILETEDGKLTLENVRILPAKDADGTDGYIAVPDDESGTEVFFLPEQVADIIE